MCKKNCGKRRNCLLRAISPFPHSVFKKLILQTCKNQGLFGNGLTLLPGDLVYPDNLDCVRCSRVDVQKFAEETKQAGIQYVGLCCGNYPALTREVAEVYGRHPPASKYRHDSRKSFVFGDHAHKYGEEMFRLRQFMLGN